MEPNEPQVKSQNTPSQQNPPKSQVGSKPFIWILVFIFFILPLLLGLFLVVMNHRNNTSSSKIRIIELNQQFNLKTNETAQIKGTSDTITFTGIKHEPCPKNQLCPGGSGPTYINYKMFVNGKVYNKSNPSHIDHYFVNSSIPGLPVHSITNTAYFTITNQ